MSSDTELPAMHAQLVVFAREIGSLYQAERARSLELEEALEGIRDMYVSTMTSLAKVVEAKDATTRGHLDRTHRYGLALAERVDPELAARPEVGYGFFLHDIGKVGVPEAVLCKPGPLDEAEWAVMREHPAIGAQIVSPIRFLAGAVEIVQTHHERWDGLGYPQGTPRRGDPARGPHLRDRRFLRRDDERPSLSRRDADSSRRSRRSAPGRAPSSTPTWRPRSSSSSTRAGCSTEHPRHRSRPRSRRPPRRGAG